MTSLQPRPPYSPEELTKLYPKELELQLVQVLLRHGERAPVSARFQSSGLPSYWPYCHAAQRLRSVVLSPNGVTGWDSLQWRRRLERFGEDDGPVIAAGPGGHVDGICQLGELTDRGRETTYALGTRLRRLYVDQLGFMPKLIADADMIYLRATPLPRALESLQQAFWGMYPLTARTASFPAPTIVTRTPADETLYPNEGNCRRFAQLTRAFAQRAAERWNDSDEMKYLTKKIGKHMPGDSKRVAVDSHPRITGIMDTVNATLAHGPETMLPSEFYDPKVRYSLETIAEEEWFAGYRENREYRMLGVGALLGDVVERMTTSIEGSQLSLDKVESSNNKLGAGKSDGKDIRFAISGCHDTTLGGILSSLGAFNGELWPPFTSHLAIEMFRKKDESVSQPISGNTSDALAQFATTPVSSGPPSPSQKPGWLASMLGLSSSSSPSPSPSRSSTPPTTPPSSPSPTGTIARQPYTNLTPSQKTALDGHYVRIRYNDKPVVIPACKKPGNHLEGDESFCTLETFKRVVDGFTPVSWKTQCGANLDKEIFGLKNAMGNLGSQESGQIEKEF